MKAKINKDHIFLLYENHTYITIPLSKYKYTEDIKMVLIPLLGFFDPLYVPVNPVIVRDFHHGEIQLIIRHTDMSCEDVSGNEIMFPTENKKFNDLFTFITYLHTISRIRGFELFRSNSDGCYMNSLLLYDTLILRLKIYDKKDRCIKKIKYLSKSVIDLDYIDGGDFDRTNRKAESKIHSIIPEINDLPFNITGIRLSKGYKWKINLDVNDYTDMQLLKLPDTNSFYLETGLSAYKLSQLVYQSTNFNVDVYTVSESEILSSRLPDDYRIGDSLVEEKLKYYDDLCYNGASVDCLIELMVYLPIMSEYLILEMYQVIFDTELDKYSVILHLEIAMSGRTYPIRRTISYHKYSGFQNLMKGLI